MPLTPKLIRISLLILLTLICQMGLFSNQNTISSSTATKAFHIEKDIAKKHILLAALKNDANKKGTVFHLFSHGRSGELRINGKWLNAAEIATYLIREIKLQKTTFKTLHIYGCEFAKGYKGKQAVAYLEKTLGITVAASTNITGVSGDWVLEVGNSSFLGMANYPYDLQCANQGVAGNQDYDCDGVVNSDDVDDDNDGILDAVECPSYYTNLVSSGGFSKTRTEITNDGWYVSSTVSNFRTSIGAVTSYPSTNKNSTLTGGVFGDMNNDNANTGLRNLLFEYNSTANAIVYNFGSLNRGAYEYAFDLGSRSSGSSARFIVQIWNASTNTLLTTLEQDAFNTLPNYSATPNYKNFTGSFSIPNTGNYFMLFRGTGTGAQPDDYIIDRVAVRLPACDFDQDGIPNHLDLDSDGDGCADALEGDGSFGSDNLQNSSIPGGNTDSNGAGNAPDYNGTAGPISQNLGTSVDTNTTSATSGLPIVAPATTASAQALGSSQNTAVESEECSDCLVGASSNGTPTASDSDGDGINDICDLDDDNDGIKDVDEECKGFISQNTDGAWKGQTASVVDVTLAGNSFEAINNEVSLSDGQMPYSINLRDGDKWVRTVGGTAEYTATFSPGVPIDEIAFYVYDLDHSNSPNAYFNFTVNGGTPAGNRIEIVDYGYASPSTYDAATSRLESSGVADQRTLFKGVGNTIITEFKIKSFNMGSADWIAYSLFGRSYCDTDGDGIRNSLDLDSDGDGCPDALEGGGSYTNTNLQNSAMPGGNGNSAEGPVTQNLGTTVDRNATSTTYGAPIVSPATTATNQTVGSSQDAAVESDECSDCLIGASSNGTPTASDSDGDGINDICDLDDDNDGILDIDEGKCVDEFNNGNQLKIASITNLPTNQIMIDCGQNGSLEELVDGDYSSIYTSGCQDFDWNATYNNRGNGFRLTFSSAYNNVNKAFIANDYNGPLGDGVKSFSFKLYDKNNVILGTETFTALNNHNLQTFTFTQLYTAVSHVDFIINTTYSRVPVQLREIAIGGDNLVCTDLDTDNDGIPNHLDLDSDGDGCPDALEGGGNHRSSNLQNSSMPGGNGNSAEGPVTQNLGTTVDTNATSATYGVPIVSPATTATNQTVGSSQDAAVESDECNDCLIGASSNGTPTASDSDGDGINDDCDLDDDNDGILDTDECVSRPVYSFVENFGTGTGRNSTPYTTYNYETSNRILDGSYGVDDNPADGYYTWHSGEDHTPGDVNGQMLLVNSSYTAGEFYRRNNIAVDANATYQLEAFFANLLKKDVCNPDIPINIKFQIEDSSNGVVLASGDTGNYPGTVTMEWDSFALSFTTTTTTPAVNLVLINNGAGGCGNDLAIDDISFYKNSCNTDVDNDGIPNQLDLDSDGDGCPDALEGGGSYTNANLQNSSMPGGNGNSAEGLVTQNLGTTVDTNAASPTYGVPIVSPATTATNQTVGSSQDAAVESEECIDCGEGASTDGTPTASDSDGDGVNDVCDLDDDNDGILDTDEVVCEPFSATGFAGKVYDNTGVTTAIDTWAEISSGTTFPYSGTVFLEVGTFQYNEKAGTNQGFGTDFDPDATDMLNYTGPAITTFNEDYFFTLEKEIAASEAGTYVIDLTNGDDHLLVYKNGVEIARQRLGFNGPYPNFVRVTLAAGDKLQYLLAEEWSDNYGLDTVVKKIDCFVDTDGDGISNQLDLDSDGDGCPDAIEGGGSFGSGDLVDSAMPGGNTGASYTGTSASPVITNLGTTVGDTPTTLGVPTVAGAGQGVGTSQITGATIQISEAPEDVSQCISDNVSVTFSATVTSNPTTAVIGYQWQVSTDNGASFSAIIPGASGATAGGTNSGVAVTLTLTDVDVSYSGNVYKIIFAAADNACPEEATAVLELKNNPTAEAGEDQIIDCITTFVSIGDATADPAYSYSWMPTNGLSDPTSPNPRAEPMTTQTYVLTVTDDVTGCTSTDEVTITVNNEVPTANAGADQRIDCETISVILGVAPTDGYRYEWIPATGLSDAMLSNPEATPREDTTYTVTVTNEETGCFSTDEVVVTVQGELPPADAGADQIIDCITTSVTLGTAAEDGYTYSWEPATALTNAAMAQPVANPSETTTYTLTVTNTDTGCASSDTVVVRVNAAPPVADAGADQIIDCNTTAVTLGTAAIEGHTYSWRPAAGLSDASIANPIATPTVTTTYTVTVTDTATGCTTEDEVVITENKTDEIQRENLSICIIDEPVDLNRFFDTPTFSGVAFPETEITWVLEESDTEISTMFNPNDYELGTYTATSTLEQGGCTLERRLTIRVHKDCIYTPCISSPDAISVSSLVTPNGDFVNDTFAIDIPINADSTDDCNISVHLQIYNRWGNLVYENTNYQNDWTGEAAKDALGDKEKSPRATYYYIIELENSGIPPKQGYFLLGLSR